MTTELTNAYSTYPLPHLIKLWERGDLTADQMVGHLLQHVCELEKRVQTLERSAAPVSSVARK